MQEVSPITTSLLWVEKDSFLDTTSSDPDDYLETTLAESSDFSESNDGKKAIKSYFSQRKYFRLPFPMEGYKDKTVSVSNCVPSFLSLVEEIQKFLTSQLSFQCGLKHRFQIDKASLELGVCFSEVLAIINESNRPDGGILAQLQRKVESEIQQFIECALDQWASETLKTLPLEESTLHDSSRILQTSLIRNLIHKYTLTSKSEAKKSSVIKQVSELTDMKLSTILTENKILSKSNCEEYEKKIQKEMNDFGQLQDLLQDLGKVEGYKRAEENCIKYLEYNCKGPHKTTTIQRSKNRLISAWDACVKQMEIEMKVLESEKKRIDDENKARLEKERAEKERISRIEKQKKEEAKAARLAAERRERELQALEKRRLEEEERVKSLLAKKELERKRIEEESKRAEELAIAAAKQRQAEEAERLRLQQYAQQMEAQRIHRENEERLRQEQVRRQQAEQAEREERERRMRLSGHHHPLLSGICAYQRRFCDLCRRDISTGEQIFHCPSCDYDECRQCFSQSRSAQGIPQQQFGFGGGGFGGGGFNGGGFGGLYRFG